MLILASKSPRRINLLKEAGYKFEVVPADIDESRLAGESPAQYVQRLAFGKARAVAAEYGPGTIVVGADTTVAFGNDCLGKPKDSVEAKRMLKSLSGQTHHVYTGWAVVGGAGGDISAVAETAVTFRILNDFEIDRYIASGEPFDKAGSYAIQGGGGAFVDEVTGSYNNVVGLPLAQVISALEKAGVERQ